MVSPAPPPSSPRFLEFRPPDVMFIRLGAESGSVEEIAETMRRQAEQGPFYLVVDFTHMAGGIDAKTRSETSKLVRPEWILGCAYINASMPVRLSIKTINLALFLVGKADYPSEFVTSEAEAMAAIEGFRKARAQK